MTGPDCGKSSLVVRFIENEFEDTYDPTIEDTYYHDMIVDSKPVKLEILDVSGIKFYIHFFRRIWLFSSLQRLVPSVRWIHMCLFSIGSKHL